MQSLHALYCRFKRDERGSVLPLAGLCVAVILGFAAVAIDLGQQTALRSQLEGTADAAALAAASQLPDERKARRKALEYAEENMPEAAHGHVLRDEDIVFGTWYSQTRQFVADGPIANAVQVTVRRSEQNGNPAPTFFLHLFGYDHADLSARSLAGNVLFENAGAAGAGGLSEKDQEKLAEMQAALEEEFQRQWRLSPHQTDALMSDKEVVEFLMENYGRAVLLR